MSLISNTNDYVCCFLFQGEDKTHTGVNAEENRATDQQVNQNSEDSKLLQLLTYWPRVNTNKHIIFFKIKIFKIKIKIPIKY